MITQRAGNTAEVTTLGEEFRAQRKRKDTPLDVPDIDDHFFTYERVKAG
ncbi:MAG: hypothetical protein OXH76_08920 [Boseongicola sp.]|nr:hypothetical protein [Boseongicola sp.]